MTGKQNMVFFLGMGLLVTAFWFGGQFSSLWTTIKTGSGGSTGGGGGAGLPPPNNPKPPKPKNGTCPTGFVYNSTLKICVPTPKNR